MSQVRANAQKPYLCVICGKPLNKRRVKYCIECRKEFKQTGRWEPSLETRKKMSASAKRVPKPTGWKHKAETRKKIRNSWTEDKKQAAKQRALKRAKDPKWLQIMSEKFTGPLNPNWKNGLAQKPYTPGFTPSLKAMVRERDHYTCQLCGKTEAELGYTLTVHHIDFSKANHSADNLISVCKHCNSIMNFGREFWMQWFQARIAKLKKMSAWQALPEHT